MKIIKAVLTTIIALSINATQITAIYGNEVEDILLTNNIEIQYVFPNDTVDITQRQGIKINNSKYFYRSGLEQSFYIPKLLNSNDDSDNQKVIKESIKVIDSNNLPLQFTIEESASGIEVVTATAALINNNNQYYIELTYKTKDLVSINGNIANIYIPGLPKNTTTEIRESGFGFTVRNEYSATLLTNKDAPEISYLQPNSIKVEELSKSIKYTVPTEDRIGNSSWIQLGTSQYYYFKIEQVANQTDFITPPVISEFSDLTSSNIYKVALPREYNENRQKVLINSISPDPYKIERDKEGNIFALFKTTANAKDVITVEGYIEQSKPALKDQPQIPNITVKEYKELIKDDKNLSIYLKPDKYWQSDDQEIKTIANNLYSEIYSDSQTLENLIKTNYRYIVDNFDYDFEKLSGENVRLGAKVALTTNRGVCMEYSDALTGLFRAQGIPARIAIGYGNDPTGAENKISNTSPVRQNIAHQWTQIWIPDFGWLSLDPTWGESERDYIGSDLDHILWYTIGSFEEKIADTTVYTADSISNGEIGEYKVYLQALKKSEFEKVEGLKVTSDLLTQYEDKPNSKLDFMLRTSTYGRILVYIIPAITIFTLAFILTGLLKTVLRRFRQAYPN